MSGRSWFPVAEFTSQGLVICPFSFVTNNTSDPDVTLLRGCGGLTGADAAGSVANGGPSAISSITRTGVGSYLVTLADGYRYATYADSNINDAADALQARVGTISNEGTGNTSPVTVAIVIRSGSTATESTGRRVSGILVLKDSGAGT